MRRGWYVACLAVVVLAQLGTALGVDQLGAGGLVSVAAGTAMACVLGVPVAVRAERVRRAHEAQEQARYQAEGGENARSMFL